MADNASSNNKIQDNITTNITRMEINVYSKSDWILFLLKGIVVLWCQLHWALNQEYSNIRSLNNLIVLTELFPTPIWLD